MLLDDILQEEWEEIWVDEDGKVLSEAAARHFKKVGVNIKRQFRCTSGLKRGKIVANRATCSKRKDPKRKRIGKKSARLKKGVRRIKTRIAKRKQVSRLVKRMNKRLKGTQSLGSH